MYLSQSCGKSLRLAYASLVLSDPSLLHFWHRETIDLGCGKPTFSTISPCVFFCASKNLLESLHPWESSNNSLVLLGVQEQPVLARGCLLALLAQESPPGRAAACTWAGSALLLGFLRIVQGAQKPGSPSPHCFCPPGLPFLISPLSPHRHPSCVCHQHNSTPS